MAFNSSTPPSSFFCPSSSSPPSPTHSSSLSATTLADRRQTKTSRYMNSEDFKSTFANKLQALRERERGATHSEPIHSAPSTPTSDTPDTFIPSTYDTFHRHLISQQLDQVSISSSPLNPLKPLTLLLSSSCISLTKLVLFKIT